MKKFIFYLFLFSISCFFSLRTSANVLDNYSNIPNKIVHPKYWSDSEIIHLIAQASDVKLYSISSSKDKYISSKAIIKIGENIECFDWQCLNSNFTMPDIYELGINKNGERLIGVKIYNSSSKMFPHETLHILTISDNKIIDNPLDCSKIAKRLESTLDITYDERFNSIILSSGFQKLIFSGNDFMHAGQTIKLCPLGNIVKISVNDKKVFLHFTISITSYKKCAIEFIAKASVQVDILDNYKLTNLHLSPLT